MRSSRVLTVPWTNKIHRVIWHHGKHQEVGRYCTQEVNLMSSLQRSHGMGWDGIHPSLEAQKQRYQWPYKKY